MANRVLMLADNLFPLGPAQELMRLALASAAQAEDVHVAVLSGRHLDWVAGLPITVHSLTDQQRSDQAGLEHANDWDGLFSRRGFQMALRLRRLIQRLNPKTIRAWGTNGLKLTLLACQQLPRTGSTIGCEIFYHEHQLPRGDLQPWRWLGALSSYRITGAVVPHESIQAKLNQGGFNRPCQIVAHSRQPLREIPHLPQQYRALARQKLRERLGVPDSTKIAGTVAPLTSCSRLKDLIWATDLLTVVRNDFHLIIFGRGWQHTNLRRFAGFTEAAEHVHFLGEPADAWALFQGLDVYWHSHLNTPLPMNVLNAMSLGIPVVSVLGTGTKELIRHQQTGLGVNFGARDEFARWTKYLIEQVASAEQISRQGKKFVETNF